MYARFWHGVRLNRRLTRDPHVWRMYLCWWLRFNLEQLPPKLPGWFYGFLSRHSFGLVAQIRWAGDATHVVAWRAGTRPEEDGKGTLPLLPAVTHLAWLGLRSKWLQRLAPLSRVLGAHTHRCDFTDAADGLLYGGKGQTMNQLFDQFIQNFDGAPIVAAALADPDVQQAIHLQPPLAESPWGAN